MFTHNVTNQNSNSKELTHNVTNQNSNSKEVSTFSISHIRIKYDFLR